LKSYARQPIPDLTLVLVTLLLAGIGLVLVYSTSAILALQRMGDSYHFIKRQLFFLALGSGLGLWALRLETEKMREWSGRLMLIALALLVLVLVPGIGHRVGGARRWLGFGFLNFQPTELAKLALIFFAADRLTKPAPEKFNWQAGMGPVVGVTLLGCALMLKEPDFGSTVLFLTLSCALLFSVGVPLWYFAAPVALGLPAAVYFVTHSAYRMRRVEVFLDPWKDPQGKGFQIVHSLMAFGSGGLLGAGLGSGLQKLYYLPEPHTDFIFSTAGEEFGLVGCLLILFLFLVMFWRGFLIAMHAQDSFLKLVAFGLTAMLGMQVLVNLYVVLGLAPTKGTTLPLLSYGGSAISMDLLAIGLLLNISRRNHAQQAR
jgi:cell division protein FtsW